MIVVDTSALVAVLRKEQSAEACAALLQSEPALVISAGTIAEALIVAEGRGVTDAMQSLLGDLGFEVVPVTADVARNVAQAYRKWGKGNHPANLNFGDCFAYALAQERDCPLLFVGNDFSKTNIKKAL